MCDCTDETYIVSEIELRGRWRKLLLYHEGEATVFVRDGDVKVVVGYKIFYFQREDIKQIKFRIVPDPDEKIFTQADWNKFREDSEQSIQRNPLIGLSPLLFSDKLTEKEIAERQRRALGSQFPIPPMEGL